MSFVPKDIRYSPLGDPSSRMTVPYSFDISSSRSWSFIRIIFRWKGSVWKSVFIEFWVWVLMYYAVFVIYRYMLAGENKEYFESVVKYVYHTMDYLPLTFLLGFFVTIVFDRWKNIFSNIAFIDNIALFVCSLIRGNDEETTTVRRNILRYFCLTQVLVFRDVSVRVRKRFPNLEALVEGGYLEPHEKQLMDETDGQFGKYWVPMNWACQLCYEMREKGRIAADVMLVNMVVEANKFRLQLEALCKYDWVPVPLAYPQVVFVSVRVYFLLCLISRQYVHNRTADDQGIVDLYVPFMTLLQFVFYMGWLKVAEALLNPLGEDDDDFECNFVLDRNIKIAMMLADDCHGQIPKQVRDRFNDAYQPLYAENSIDVPNYRLQGSAAMSMPEAEEKFVRMVPHPTASAMPSRRGSLASQQSNGSAKSNSMWVANLREQLNRRLVNSASVESAIREGMDRRRYGRADKVP
ncbi:bestrophin-3, partial [Aphelenchoides avenae]